MTTPANTWTDDRVETLSKLWREGMRASQIARDLGHGITATLSSARSTGWASQAARRRACREPDGPNSAGNGGVASRTGPSRLAPRRRPWGERPTFHFPRPGSPASSASGGGAMPMADGRSAGRRLCLCGRPAVHGAYCAPHAAVAYKPTERNHLIRLAGPAALA